MGSAEERQALVTSQQEFYQPGDTIKVFDGSDKLIVVGMIFVDKRPGLEESILEFINLPKTWNRITVNNEGSISRALITRNKKQSEVQYSATKKNWKTWTVGNIGITLLFILTGLYVLFTIGVSGGPNHGEHPFVVNIIHLSVFLYCGPAWESNDFYSYLFFMIAALAISIWVLALVGADVRLPRILMLIFYIGMFVVLVNKEYSPYANWIGHDSIQIYVPENQRHKIELLDSKNISLMENNLSQNIESRIIYFWSEPTTPQAVRVILPDNKALSIGLDKRPLLTPEEGLLNWFGTKQNTSTFWSAAFFMVKAYLGFFVIVIISLVVVDFFASKKEEKNSS